MSHERDVQKKAGGFLVRQHHKLRFNELSETFFGRVILAKCPDSSVTTAITVQLSLCDLFRRGKPDELAAALENVTFTLSPKIAEIGADLLSAVFGIELKPGTTTEPALDFYQNYIESRLRWLKSGDKGDKRLPCIEDFTSRTNGKLMIFEIVVRPAILREQRWRTKSCCLCFWKSTDSSTSSISTSKATLGSTTSP